MDRAAIRDYLKLTAMNDAQAEALSNIFAEMATTHDLAALDARLTGRMDALDARLTGRMAEFESRLTWRMIAVVGFFATASAMFNVYAG